MEIPAKIDGPVSFYVYRLKIGSIDKLILLFGDEHMRPKYTCDPCKTKNCYSLVKFLENTFKNTEVCADFFLEKHYIKHPDQSYTFTKGLLMHDVESKFKTCLQPSKIECPKFGNVRMHYADPRQMFRKRSLVEYLFPDLKYYMRKLTEPLEPKPKDVRKFKNKMREMKEIIKPRFEEAIKYIIGLSKNPPKDSKVPKVVLALRDKLQKQWKALDPKIRRKIRPSIKALYKEYLKNVYRMWEIYLEEDIDPIYQYIEVDLGFRVYLLWELAIFMDVYLSFRMLRKDLSDSHIVIVYAGYHHIHGYKIFLNKLQKPIFQMKRKIGNKCIRIPKEIRDEIKTITSNFPKYRCPFERSEMIEAISYYYYGMEEEYIEKSISMVAKKYNLTKKEALNKIWDELKIL